MCNGAPEKKDGVVPFSHKGVIVDTGTVWYMDGRKIVIDQPVLHYHNTNGDVYTKYLSFQFQDDKSWNICTHRMFSSAKLEDPIKDVFITPRQILDAKPCENGIKALGVTIGVITINDMAWEASMKISVNGHMDRAYKVSVLYDWYERTCKSVPPVSYLLFLAKLLKLVPDRSMGVDEATLKRLLGIRE